MGQGETYVGTGKRNAGEFRNDMLEFDIVGFKELAACWYIVEKITDAEVCTACSCNLIGSQML